MIIKTKNHKRKWQRKFIKMIFDYSSDKKKYVTKIALENPNLINKKMRNYRNTYSNTIHRLRKIF
jgi:esterase/lipase